jgi:tRNA threonylcarbamoyladenosine biosynthesis protein TsaE
MEECIFIRSESPEATEAFGEALGSFLEAGDWLGLNGDLGTGKTCFVRGLARGSDVPEDSQVTSPTFTLLNIYPGRHPVFHLDLYRLLSEDDLEAIGYYDLFIEEGLVVVEWAARIASSAPESHLRCDFYQDGEAREIRVFWKEWSGERVERLRRCLLPWTRQESTLS